MPISEDMGALEALFAANGSLLKGLIEKRATSHPI